MTDIKKTIEELKRLKAKATPGLWISDGVDCAIRVDGRYTGVCPHFGNRSAAECDQIYRDFTLIAAVRNALPELLAELERLEARAENAEKAALKTLERFREKCGWCRDYNDRTCAHDGDWNACNKYVFQTTVEELAEDERLMAEWVRQLEARAEKAEAERDWLLENLTELSEMCPYAEGFSLDSSCEECDGVDNIAKCWRKLLAKVGHEREAASTDK